MTNVQAINVPIQVSADNGNTWETIVCISEHTLPIVSAVNKLNTQCGVAAGLGPVEFNPTGTAATNLDDNAGQVSVKDLVNWLILQTKLKYRMQTPGTGSSIGSNFYLSGFCYVTKAEIKETVGDVETFTFELTGIGIPSTVPGT